MFIRTRKSGKRFSSNQLIRTYREAGKVKQMVVANLGRDTNLIDAAVHTLMSANFIQGGYVAQARAELLRIVPLLSDEDLRTADAKYEADRLTHNNDPFWGGHQLPPATLAAYKAAA